MLVQLLLVQFATVCCPSFYDVFLGHECPPFFILNCCEFCLPLSVDVCYQFVHLSCFTITLVSFYAPALVLQPFGFILSCCFAYLVALCCSVSLCSFVIFRDVSSLLQFSFYFYQSHGYMCDPFLSDLFLQRYRLFYRL